MADGASSSPEPASSPAREAIRSVIEYYDACHIDYRILWRTSHNLSIHFGFYDQDHRTHEAALLNMNRVLAEKASILAQDEVLDAGCGVGGSGVWLAREIGARTTGVNVQPLHLRIARDKAQKLGVADKVRFVEVDYCDTGLPDASYDVVWALESLCHCADQQEFLAEAYRLLRPGGRLVIADFIRLRGDLSARDERRMRRWLDGWSLPDLASFDDFGDHLRDAGFEKIQSDDVTPHVAPSSRRIFLASLVVWPLSRPAELLRLRTPRQTANVVASYYQYSTFRAGLWGYAIHTARKPVDPVAVESASGSPRS